jgi:hypothetical protein
MTVAQMVDGGARSLLGRLQRFAAEWARPTPSPVRSWRKVTRGMWAIDPAQRTRWLLALLPSLVVLVRLDGAARLALAADGPSFVTVGAPPPSIFMTAFPLHRLHRFRRRAFSNQWDTKTGGALADAR